MKFCDLSFNGLIFPVCYSRVTDLNELERPDKLSQDDSKYCGGRVSKLVEDGEDGDEDCSESTGEETNEKGTRRAFAGGKERSHSEALGNHIEIELSCTF